MGRNKKGSMRRSTQLQHPSSLLGEFGAEVSKEGDSGITMIPKVFYKSMAASSLNCSYRAPGTMHSNKKNKSIHSIDVLYWCIEA